MMRIGDLRNEFKTISEFESIICKKDIKKRKNFQRLEFLGDKVLALIDKLEIEVTDIKKLVFDINDDPLGLFAYRRFNHYSKEGSNKS